MLNGLKVLKLLAFISLLGNKTLDLFVLLNIFFIFATNKGTHEITYDC